MHLIILVYLYKMMSHINKTEHITALFPPMSSRHSTLV